MVFIRSTFEDWESIVSFKFNMYVIIIINNFKF